ncbi:hypothetical protein DFH09DRAFT_1052493 [Mycena vulgaris]|nr:hypothetical protein DFH09DRAFT_1052493 [Mycena vulgaris]
MLTCRRVYWVIQDSCFTLTRLLSPFLGDATEVARFQRMQERSGTIISGSIPLQFFNRITWPDSDLDLYAHRTSADIPVRFILSNGYTFDPRKSQKPDALEQLLVSVQDKPPSYLGRGIADVLDFHKGEKKIQLIIATDTPMETILSFHSTPVMNVLTHNYGYALYPCSTFVTRQALVVETVGAGQEAGRQKYVDRGWTMVKALSTSRDSELAVRMLRWVGDSYTWTIPLRPARANATSGPDLCGINSWKLDCDSDTIWTKWGILKHPALEYNYIIADTSAVLALSDDVLVPSSPWAVDTELYSAIIHQRESTSHSCLE